MNLCWKRAREKSRISSPTSLCTGRSISSIRRTRTTRAREGYVPGASAPPTLRRRRRSGRGTGAAFRSEPPSSCRCAAVASVEGLCFASLLPRSAAPVCLPRAHLRRGEGSHGPLAQTMPEHAAIRPRRAKTSPQKKKT